MGANNEIKKYQTKSTIAEAIQLKDNNSDQVAEFMNAVDFVDERVPIPNKPHETQHRLNVFAIDGDIPHEYTIKEGAFVVKSNDKFYCMSEDEFNNKFEQTNHAYWITERTWYCRHTCSICKFCFSYDLHGEKTINIKEFNYCPRCGTKMDAEDDK